MTGPSASLWHVNNERRSVMRRLRHETVTTLRYRAVSHIGPGGASVHDRSRAGLHPAVAGSGQGRSAGEPDLDPCSDGLMAGPRAALFRRGGVRRAHRATPVPPKY